MPKKNKPILEESGHGLVWAEFVEVGCPAKKEDYFITEKEVLNLDIVKKALDKTQQATIERIEKKTRKYVMGVCQNCMADQSAGDERDEPHEDNCITDILDKLKKG